MLTLDELVLIPFVLAKEHLRHLRIAAEQLHHTLDRLARELLALLRSKALEFCLLGSRIRRLVERVVVIRAVVLK